MLYRSSYRRKSPRKRQKKNRALRRCLALLLFLIIIAVVFDIRMRPYIAHYGENLSKNMAMQAMDAAVQKVLASEKLNYDDIIKISRGADGDIEALETDTATVNQLKGAVNIAILDEMASSAYSQIAVPIGNTLGSPLLFGHGPKVAYRISVNGGAVTELSSSFESAGINQTRHLIWIDVKMSVLAVMAGSTSNVDVDSQYLVADTVLVGRVPDIYPFGLGTATTTNTTTTTN